MAKYDADELREKAHWHTLSEEELAEVIQRINAYLSGNNGNDSELDALLEALGYTGAFTGLRPGFQELVEKFLVYPTNPDISATALSVLCTDWDLDREYTSQIKSFIKGVEWDEGIVQIMAICVAGAYAAKARDKEMLEFLLDAFKNKDYPSQVRNNIYRAIARALGFHWDEVHDIDPDHFSEIPFASDIIAKAQQMLQESKKN